MNLAEVAADICPETPLDLGIVRAVKALRDIDVHTTESCEGGEGHSFKRPTVKFNGSSAEGWRALAALRELDLPVIRLMRTWDVYLDEPDGPFWMIEFARRLD